VDRAAGPDATTSTDSVTWQIDVTIRNAGRLPTALRQAQLVKIVRPDRVRLRLPDDLTEGDAPPAAITTPATRDKTIDLGWLDAAETATATFQLRVPAGIDPFDLTVEVLSTRGGRVERDVRIGR
jgi:hypothetical protein